MNRIFFISDLHLNHKNIIKYCFRPFNSVNQMNRILIKKWNNKVYKNDIVFYLGDISFRDVEYWLSKLNGNIIFIRGNHDRNLNFKYYNQYLLRYKDKRFLLIHNPYYKPSNWDDWIIHGHKHNNNLKEYPLINKKQKRINVSCELLNYEPIEINELIESIE